jgi:tRNA A37 threonylcarbamoyladenosine biosynthesis protein TsaE
MNPDPSNTIFQKAVAFVNQTNKHLFLTGKAGTGKTTFLKYIKENTFKKIAVVAPTGVAAINAGGVTIHSFFQLPLGPFIPSQRNYWGSYEGEMNNPATLIKNLRLTTAKRDVIRELDVLIIDEVSMVRADLLDAVDTVMRHVRRQLFVPFGGVQMIYIGDLFQLPPVVRNEEWELLKEYYPSAFFFDAVAIKQAYPLYIELKKIYRQKDDSFIHILNNIRNNCCTADDLEFLHQFYKPGYSPDKEENFITLTSHNGKADTINQNELQKLASPQHTYEATIKGEFTERMYPAEKALYLKEGAQIMFIKNDKGEVRRYYNGKIGTISKLEKDKILVTFANEPGELELEREIWKNIRYKYSQDKDHVDEEELGTFTQYPIRLAWAITIHKSQGLTFEKAIIDAGQSFAPGQVYVSLSRLTGLSGLVLYSRILPHTISTDQRVVDFVQNEIGEERLQQTLEEEQKTFVRHSLMNGFAWEKLVDIVSNHYDAYEGRQIPEKNSCIEWAQQLVGHVKAQHEVSIKFKKLLEHLFTTCEIDKYTQLNMRTAAAAKYFLEEIEQTLLGATNDHLKIVKTRPKSKKYVKELEQLLTAFKRKKHQVQQALQLGEALHKTSNINEVLQLLKDHQKPITVSTAGNEDNNGKKSKPEKGESGRLSLHLFKQGKSIADIAQERNFAQSTIEGHLASFIVTGEVDVLDLVEPARLETMLPVISKLNAVDEEAASSALPSPTNKPKIPNYTTIRENLPADFTYGEIRAALNYIEWEKANKAQVV